MRNRKEAGRRRKDYSVLERKVFFRVLFMIVLSVAFVLGVRELLRGHIADAIVEFLARAFKLDAGDALRIYQYSIRNNMELIIVATIFLVLILFFRICIAWVTKYFDEISDGMDLMVEQGEEDIRLSPELGFMEIRLNRCKTILHQREQEARLAEQRKNELVMYLAHDLKTPLTSVIGYLDLMAQIPEMPAQQRAKYLDIALEKANRLEELLNEFFEITRYNMQSIALTKDNVNLSYLLRQMAEEFYPMLAAKHQAIALEAGEDVIIEADANQLARVFNNILKNAIAYGDPGTPITITVREGEQVTVQIQNQGKEIPRQKLDSLFEKFYRLEESRPTNTGNAGLGLAIAKEIVLLHGGTISAESREHTITFTVALPSLQGEE